MPDAPMDAIENSMEFIYKLNAMESAALSAEPAKEGYGDKRNAVLEHVATLERTVAELREELDQWTKWGTIEVAIRNSSVASSMKHWEDRAESAEAALKKMREENERLRAECGVRQITGYQKGKAEAEAIAAELREAWQSAERQIVLMRANHKATEAEREELRERLARSNRDAEWQQQE